MCIINLLCIPHIFHAQRDFSNNLRKYSTKRIKSTKYSRKRKEKRWFYRQIKEVDFYLQFVWRKGVGGGRGDINFKGQCFSLQTEEMPSKNRSNRQKLSNVDYINLSLPSYIICCYSYQKLDAVMCIATATYQVKAQLKSQKIHFQDYGIQLTYRIVNSPN